MFCRVLLTKRAMKKKEMKRPRLEQEKPSQGVTQFFSNSEPRLSAGKARLSGGKARLSAAGVSSPVVGSKAKAHVGKGWSFRVYARERVLLRAQAHPALAQAHQSHAQA